MPWLEYLKRNWLVASLVICLLAAVTPSFACGQDQSIRFLVTETNALAARLAAIETASTSICIATFRIRDDETGGQLLSALRAAADRGVNVRLLVDAHPNSINLPKPLIRYLTERGVSIRERPFDARSKLEIGRPRLHDKLFVVDENKAIIGSHNLDMLSMNHNSEVGLLVCCSGFACEAMSLFRSLANDSLCLNHVRLFRYEAREGNASDEKIKQYQRMRWVAPWIRRYL